MSFELYVYCAERAQTVGFDGGLLSSPRLDNLTSVHACIDGLCRADGEAINVAVLYDNEEIGSNTRRGADSATLTVLLEKLALALGMDRQGFLNACLNGMLLSCDAAHACTRTTRSSPTRHMRPSSAAVSRSSGRRAIPPRRRPAP